MNPQTPSLQIAHLSKRYGASPVFSDVSLSVAPGEFVAIMGESGVGKSTLLNCMAGLDTWDSGSVHVGGVDLGKLGDDQRAALRRTQIGFVFQAFHVLPHLDVAQNVALPLLLLGTPNAARVDALLARRAALLTSAAKADCAVALLLVVGAVGMFLAYIHHITTSIGVARMLQRTAQQSRDLLADGQASAWPTTPRELEEPVASRVLAADRSGYVDAVDTPALVRLASRHGVRVELLHPLGSFVAHGSPLLVVHELPAADAPAPEAVLALVSPAGERTMDQDVGYGIRRLVDIAERALSPGINDPTTAVQVLDQLHDLLRRMVTAPQTWPVRPDEEGTVRVVLRQPTMADVVELALADIAHWGEDHRRVRERIATIMDDLRAAALDEHRSGLG